MRRCPGLARRKLTRWRPLVGRLAVVCVFVGLSHPAASEPLPSRAEPVADYRISVTLDPDRHQLQGTERIVWRNTSTDAVSDLWFHLYLNAFKNNRSTFFRESGGQLRSIGAESDGWGSIDVTSLRLAEGQKTGRDLLPGAQFMSPDDGNVDDQTVWRVLLPTAVPPDASIALDVEFRATLPPVYARTGYDKDFHLVGQWFPKLGVYEAAGTRGRVTGGWNCHQFHATSEFYANFGNYSVDITVPARFIVGATGMRTASRQNADGTVTYQYEQANVHDFAWTASTRFVEVRRTFSGTRDVTDTEYAEWGRRLQRPPDEMRLSDVDILILLQPEHRPQTERMMSAAMWAIKQFGLRYGRYPHRTLTIVDPPAGGLGAAGMEYPTFITGGTTVAFNRWPFRRILVPETVIVHEFGHQYWQGMVASNEFEEAWLDEGVNTYSETKVMDARYGAAASYGTLFGLSVGSREMTRSLNGPWRVFDAIRTLTWQFSSQNAWGFNSYAKPGLLLASLEALIGEETMDRVMRTYQERWRFRHPTSEDFYATASQVAGRDLRGYFAQTVESSEVLDYEVSAVDSRRELAVLGFVDGAGGREIKKPASTSETDADNEPTGGPFESSVTVRRRGGVRIPVVLELKFEGERPERLTWDGEDRWRRFTFVRPSRLEWANIDPDRQVLLDVNFANNSRRVKPDRRVGLSLSTRWMFWVQNLFSLLSV